MNLNKMYGRSNETLSMTSSCIFGIKKGKKIILTSRKTHALFYDTSSTHDDDDDHNIVLKV